MYFSAKAATQLTVVDIKELGISFSRYLGFHSMSLYMLWLLHSSQYINKGLNLLEDRKVPNEEKRLTQALKSN